MPSLRKDLELPGLLKTVFSRFQHVKDTATNGRSRISLVNCLMSGLAIFSLKIPSLLQFDQSKDNALIKHNLKTLFHVDKAPCDTYLRERLDDVSPELLRPAFKAIFANLQRGKELEPFQFINGHYLLSVDGTGYFSSNKVHCDSCCEKHHRNGKVEYYHQMLGAVLIHPEHKQVIPFAPEPIIKEDGAKKNDCERNAAKRLLSDLRREHPHLKLIVVEDGLASNGPHIQLLKSLNMQFILGAKPKDHTFLFDWVLNSKTESHEITDEKNVIHRFRFINNVPLNDANFDSAVNFLEYWEVKPDGKEQHFSWVTDLALTKESVYQIMKGGRARWKIENETFNTLKNQGYQFEHNFGHGTKHLTTVFAYLMMLAFLVDQAQALCSRLFQHALATAKSKTRLWQKVRGFFTHFLVDTWEDLYLSIAYKSQAIQLQPDTS